MPDQSNKSRGLILVNALVFAVIAATLVAGLVRWASGLVRSEQRLLTKEQAFHIAESGIDYCRWHLAHSPSDYKDGTTTPGPYIHQVTNKDGDVIGDFRLTITPPATGTTVVKVRSEGRVASDTAAVRTLEATLAIPSLAKFAVVANDVMRFGEGTEVFGPIHSNDGIRFDGLAHNIITSTKDKYVDPDNGSSWRYGVYTTVGTTDPSPPAVVPYRPDVFAAGRQFPVASFDFAGMTTDLSQMKATAQANSRYFAASGAQGYRVVLKIDDTFDLYRVNTLRTAPNNCTNSQNQTGWGTWSIGTSGGSQTFLANYSFPSNGVIFFEDHIWVEGTIRTARLTIAAGRFPDNSSTRRSITVNDDVLYTYYDGRDVLSLIAQDNFNVGLFSQDDLRIDGAIIAQNGRAGRYYYDSDCKSGGTNYYNRAQLTLYGMIGTNKRYGFAYTDDTGYASRDIIYDGNLLYGPPPSFPLTSDQYSVISWDEVK